MKQNTRRSSSSPAMGFDDAAIFAGAKATLAIATPLTFLSLQFLSAPYGKHYRAGWGPNLPSRLAWPLMESPSLILPLILHPLGQHRRHPLALLPAALFLLHYLHRTLLYPLTLPTTTSKPFPLSIAALAFIFNLLNAYLQIRHSSHYADYPHFATIISPRVFIGISIFFIGMWVNVWSDRVLVRLKKGGGGGYRVPRGGVFQLVSCPNYLGEVVDWLGWSVVAWSWPAFGFFLYTCANLVPRAMANHRWYLDKFGDEYPRSRKAIIPFLY